MDKKTEYRSVGYVEGRVELRATQDGGAKMITGDAIVYERESVVLHDSRIGAFVEIIKRGALDNADVSRVVARTNHNDGILLGTSWAKTLRLRNSPSVLAYEVDIPNTSAGKDTEVYMERGDISGSSFAFVSDVTKDVWTDNRSQGIPSIREVHSILTLYDVSPVTTPAYREATSALRSFDYFEQHLKEETDALAAEQTRKEEIKADSKTLAAIHKHKNITR